MSGRPKEGASRPAAHPFLVWVLLGAVLVGLVPLTRVLYTSARAAHGAAHGTAGTPGTVTLVGMRGKHEVCVGDFRGGTVRERDVVHLSGTCVPGRKLTGRHLSERNAWAKGIYTEGGGGWRSLGVLAGLCALILAIIGLPWLLLTLLWGLRALLWPLSRKAD